MIKEVEYTRIDWECDSCTSTIVGLVVPHPTGWLLLKESHGTQWVFCGIMCLLDFMKSKSRLIT